MKRYSDGQIRAFKALSRYTVESGRELMKFEFFSDGSGNVSSWDGNIHFTWYDAGGMLEVIEEMESFKAIETIEDLQENLKKLGGMDGYFYSAYVDEYGVGVYALTEDPEYAQKAANIEADNLEDLTVKFNRLLRGETLHVH